MQALGKLYIASHLSLKSRPLLISKCKMQMKTLQKAECSLIKLAEGLERVAFIGKIRRSFSGQLSFYWVPWMNLGQIVEWKNPAGNLWSFIL